MSTAILVVLGADASRDVHRYHKALRGGSLPPDVQAQCQEVVQALSKLIYAVERELDSRKPEAT